MEQRFANLVTEIGINLQRGQVVMISAETGHQPFVEVLQETLRAYGASKILLDITNPHVEAQRLRCETIDALSTPSSAVVSLYDEWSKSHGARIKLCSSTAPELLRDVDSAKASALNFTKRRERSAYYRDVASRDSSQWCVVAPPTPAWARQVFPELAPDSAYAALKQAVFKCMRLDDENPIASWRKHLAGVAERRERLNALGLRQLYFAGPATDLTVKLRPEAVFFGGQKTAMNGVPFIANMPTEEIFTTPDCGETEGLARVTRPVKIDGKLVTGLRLEFEKGSIVSFCADENQAAFAALIEGDAGAHRLGEIALVGVDSRVYQTELFFGETLFDENAACHAAVGDAYAKCLRGGQTLERKQLEALGCNFSARSVHEDLMISDNQTDVIGRTAKGIVTLIRNGAWVF
jgi:aminopeptidase